MLIKNKTKFTFLAVALFFAAISFVACSNATEEKSDAPKADTPAVQAPEPVAPAGDDTTVLPGNTKPTPEKP